MTELTTHCIDISWPLTSTLGDGGILGRPIDGSRLPVLAIGLHVPFFLTRHSVDNVQCPHIMMANHRYRLMTYLVTESLIKEVNIYHTFELLRRSK